MQKLPKYIQRIDDGELFALNKDGKTYSIDRLKKDFPDSIHNTYSYYQLIGDEKCTHCSGTGKIRNNSFRVLDIE